MQKEVSREELYELVWSKPMTHLALELGISDVMIGKLCKQLDVPRPPRGYWMGLTSEKKKHKWVKPPLTIIQPTSLTFQQVVERHYNERYRQESRSFDWENVDAQIPSPPSEYSEPVSDHANNLLQHLPNLAAFETYKDLHSVTQKLIIADEQRKTKNFYFPWDKPIFKDDAGKKLLQSLNGFVWTIEALGGTVSTRGRVHITTQYSLLGTHSEFVFNVFDPNPYDWRALRPKKTSQNELSICFTKGSSNWGSVQRGGKRPEEINSDYVAGLVKEILFKNEDDFRKSIFREYEYCIDSRERLIKRTEQKRLLKLKKERERIAALNARREAELFDAVERMRKADAIRLLVERFQSKQTMRNKPVEGFEKWSRWALQFADEIDPINMSSKHLQSWISK